MSSERLSHIERAALIDAVASAIRHDARNKLGSVRNASYYIRQKVANTEVYKTDARIAGFFELIEESLASLDLLLTERMGHKLPQMPTAQPTWLGAAVEASLCAALPTDRLKLTLALEDRTAVAASADELALIVRCLIDNAVEAMPDGGCLTIKTYDTPNTVVLSIQDSGPGFNAECAHHAFDPFYTTKPGHVGLGLCLVRRVAARYAGYAIIEPSTSGAQIKVSFPKPAAELASELSDRASDA